MRNMTALALSGAMILGALAPVQAQDAGAGYDRPASFAELAEQISPSVVNITTTTVIEGRTDEGNPFGPGSPFEDFFKDFQGPDGDQPQRSSALGSGFVISADGYIVTNNHVIEGADEIEIEFFPEEGERSRRLPATLVGTDPVTDIALLKVESDEPLEFVDFGDSNGEDAEVGDWVLAMGNPLGQGFSISAGIISARQRSLQKAYDDYIQTDAAINRGNSGGPLFDMNGDVIGVNTAILSPTGGSIGIGFAQASNVVTQVVDQLREFGETRRGWLGVRIQEVTEDMIGAIEGLDEARGAMISDVPEGPAKDAGLQASDVIVEFDGVEIEDTGELVAIVGAAPVGATVPVTVLRAGELLEFQVTLGRRETAQGIDGGDEPMEPEVTEFLGMTVQEVTPDLAQELKLSAENGLIVTDVDPASAAADKGLRVGDVLTEAAQQPLNRPSDLQDAIEASQEAGRKSILLLVRRGGTPRFVALPLPKE